VRFSPPALGSVLRLALALPGLAFGLCGCAHAHDEPTMHSRMPEPGVGASGDAVAAPERGPVSAPYQTVLATWYGNAFAGKKTTNGERFDPQAMTAAHRKLPFGTWVEVRRVDTGGTVRVRINDRGPWGDSRNVIDLSYRAAKALGFVEKGAAKVEIWVVSGP
jgi:rare lipoprotein A